MKTRTKLMTILVCTVISAITPAYADEGMGLDELIEEALNGNRALKALSYKVDEMAGKEPQSGALTDPMASIGIVNDGFDGITVGERAMSRYSFGISQKFPFPGKLSTQGKVAEYNTIAARNLYEDMRLKVASDVKMLYYDLYRAQKVKKLLEEKRVYLEALEKSTLASYSLGRRGVSDVLVSQTEKYRTIEKIESQERSIDSAGAKLMQTLGRDMPAGIPELREPEKTVFTESIDALMGRAEKSSYLLRSLRARVDASAAQVKLKELDYFPDITVGVNYSPRFSDTFDDIWGASLSFSIPLYFRSRQRAALNEAEAANNRTEEEYHDQLLRIREEITSSLSVIRTSDRVLSLYREGIIQKAKESMQSSIASYENNKTDVDAVLRTINATIEYEILFVERLVEREKTIAKLFALTGGTIE